MLVYVCMSNFMLNNFFFIKLWLFILNPWRTDRRITKHFIEYVKDICFSHFLVLDPILMYWPFIINHSVCSLGAYQKCEEKISGLSSANLSWQNRHFMKKNSLTKWLIYWLTEHCRWTVGTMQFVTKSNQ